MVQITATVDGAEGVPVPLLWLGAESRQPRARVLGVLPRSVFVAQPAAILRDLVGFSDVVEPPAEALTERVAREGAASNAVFGETPETWSPLGSTDVPDGAAARLAGWSDGPVAAQAADDPRPGLAVDVDAGSWTTVTWRTTDGTWATTTAYAPDAFVAVLPPGTTEVALDLSDDLDLTDEVDRAAGLDRAADEVAARWRAYLGEGTRVVDGEEPVTAEDPVVRLRLPWTARAGYVVGRLLRRWTRGTLTSPTDPSFRFRLARHTDSAPDVVAACPELHAADTAEVMVVVAHGVMGCAVPVAGVVHEALRAAGLDVPVVRYEHDTWRPVAHSAHDLATGLRAVGAREVLVVGHSRGGLLARHAQTLLPDDGPHLRIITLGAPFAGTPLIAAAEQGRRGLGAGVAALAGLGGPVVDIATQAVLGNLRHQLPEGIRDLHEESSFLGLLRALPSPTLTAVAGEADPQGVGDSWGFGDGAFAAFFDGPNDRVVSVASATAATDASRVVVACDHSSYAHVDVVRALVVDATRDLARGTGGPHRSVSDGPDRSVLEQGDVYQP
ncbi:hypothetical protein [Oerskovia flava]|uniref:hypothetical protein n=1 Tax=Oerskovia flava TaxID=2986422 RepID=UPI0022402005|nr:hypothetical protein [Oerskovia sp. JB1-3-2]